MPRLMEKNDWLQTVADVDAAQIAKPKCKSARNYIGYSRKFYRGRISTAEIMHELREGEE